VSQFTQSVTQQAFQAAGSWAGQAQHVQEQALSGARQALGGTSQLLQNLPHFSN
jgi:hypothetical protein